jgi:hypothetical protein
MARTALLLVVALGAGTVLGYYLASDGERASRTTKPRSDLPEATTSAVESLPAPPLARGTGKISGRVVFERIPAGEYDVVEWPRTMRVRVPQQTHVRFEGAEKED